MNTTMITAEDVRKYLLSRYAEQIVGKGRNPDEIPDSFDFLLEGIVDSFGILEMISAMENKFGMELDMSELDAEEMTVLGPLSRYIAAQAGKELIT